MGLDTFTTFLQNLDAALNDEFGRLDHVSPTVGQVPNNSRRSSPWRLPERQPHCSKFASGCIISRMFTCPTCGRPTLHFQNTIQRGELVDRRIRCDDCGYNRPISWQEKRSLLVQIGIAKGQKRTKPRGERNAGAGGC